MDYASVILQLALSGLATGGIYALVALGFNIVFRSTDAINFAQGEWVMAGGMIAAFLYQAAGLPLWTVVPIGALAVVALGAASERLAVHPLTSPGPMLITLITIGVAVATKAGVMLTLGKAPAGLPAFTGSTPVHIGNAAIPPQALWVLVTMALVMVASHFFFERTLLGKAMRAAAADREAAALVGINVGGMVTRAFMIAAGVGALAGIVVTPITMTSFNAGTFLGFKGFSAAMLGGLGNPYGALVGGLLLGLLEALSAGLISSAYKDAVAFVVLLFILFVRPDGLLGRAAVSRV
jgi:branched-chain amino acid transport system permease protein